MSNPRRRDLIGQVRVTAISPTTRNAEVKIMKSFNMVRIVMFALAVAVAAQGDWAAGAADRTAGAPTGVEIGRRPLQPYDAKILPGFDPALKAVTVLPSPGEAPKVTREGKGWLEVYADGRRVLRLKGTPYEMGYQHGKLLAADVRRMCNTILMTVGMVETVRTGEAFIETLRKIYARTKPHIPAEYIEEGRGLAEGAGLPHETIMLANIFPERFHCSGFALWGKATADGKLYHGRILDYMNEIGLQDVAVVTVYEPEGAIPWVNIGYAGFLGSVTGMNAEKVAIGEMGGRGEGKWDGMPMSYLLRHTLEHAKTLDEALKSYQKTPRTCEYYYVVSDGKIPSARGLAATPEKLEIVRPGEAHKLLPHQVKDGVLLSAGDRYKRLALRAQAHYGSFDAAESLALMRRPVAMESCLHAVLFCPTDGRFWVANASHDKKPASEEPYREYNLFEMLKAGR